jgi:hypothetical protein
MNTQPTHTAIIEGKIRGADKWEIVLGASSLRELESQMSAHGFWTRYLGPNRRLLVVFNPETDNVECIYRKAIARAEGK